MKNNQNNVEVNNQTNKIKSLVEYFETNHPTLKKKENILNFQKRPSLAPLNDKVEVNMNINNDIEIKKSLANKNIMLLINEEEEKIEKENKIEKEEENIENEIKKEKEEENIENEIKIKEEENLENEINKQKEEKVEKDEKKEKEEKREKENKNAQENLLKEILDIDEEKIITKLSELKINIISLLSNSVNSISSKFESFIDIMINWYKEQNQKISIVSLDINQKINTRKIKMNEKISIIFKILDNLNSSINSQINLLDLFLNGDFIDNNFPLEEFIVKNSDLMINGNFLAKIDTNTLLMNKIFENKELTEIFQNYYLKRKINYSKIKHIKIKIKNINELVATNNKIHEVNSDENNFADKVNSITFDNLNLTSFPSEKVLINKLKNLETFKIKKCTNLYNTNIYKSIINNAVDLKIIKLEGIQLTDKSLNEFFLNITKINSLEKSINYLSFRHNNLSSINLKVKNAIFIDLEMIDFSSNNIYFFSPKNFRIFPKLKVIDLSDNNINNNLLFEGILKSKKSKLINFISFMSKNIFLYNVDKNNQKYIKYLNENLPELEFNLKRINLSLLYDKHNNHEIIQLRFSPSIKLSLIKLNLSFCGLNDKVIFSFFKNNFDLIKLKILNLNHNFISVDFFSLFDDENNIIFLEKIKKIDLSFNIINCNGKSDIEKINKFIDNHKFLKILKLQNNNILNILKKKTEKNEQNEYNDEINTFINITEKRHIMIEVQFEMSSLIDNERFKKILLYKSKC